MQVSIYILFLKRNKFNTKNLISKKIYKQRVSHTTNNYITHYKTNHKLVAYNIKEDYNSSSFYSY